jgi:hypothetical protein
MDNLSLGITSFLPISREVKSVKVLHFDIRTIYILSQPHFGLSVRMRLTLPKVGTWSPPGLLKPQSSITGVKTPRIRVLFI